METRDLVIIGGGSAGMAAAISAFDNGVKDILILEKGEFLGGILNQCIHNGFGLHEFNEELTGPEFLTRFVNQIEQRRIEYKLNTYVLSLSQDKTISYVNRVDGMATIKAKSIIVATGCLERSAGAIGIPGERPSGVITAGQAQLYLNEYGYLVGKKVFILGSGDIGLIMARRMTLEGAKVLGVAELMPYSNGLNRNIQQCLKDFDIPLYLSHTVSKIIGKDKLEAIEVSEVDSSLKVIEGTARRFEVDTLLLSIGLIPNNALLNAIGAPQSKTRGSCVNEHMETSFDGLFACGNVLHVHDLVDYVVEEARVAGLGASKYLKGELIRGEHKILTEAGEGIGYVVPSQIDLDEAEDFIELKFRVKRPSKDVYIVYSCDGKIIKKVYKSAIIPSEMEIYKLPKNLLKNNYKAINVGLEKKEASK
ncbi:MAG TPA: pyridine nucleotide-disulfide oxidoreductase [Firmicutes bacterium]|nr:pyridine nucleotide-disulfide oxidoreductase [Bacillota bacterium]HBM70772.1 pyridine nucleotide-disulfide oxidoreductase [Bacillota bacterium]